MVDKSFWGWIWIRYKESVREQTATAELGILYHSESGERTEYEACYLKSPIQVHISINLVERDERERETYNCYRRQM